MALSRDVDQAPYLWLFDLFIMVVVEFEAGTHYTEI